MIKRRLITYSTLINVSQVEQGVVPLPLADKGLGVVVREGELSLPNFKLINLSHISSSSGTVLAIRKSNNIWLLTSSNYILNKKLYKLKAPAMSRLLSIIIRLVNSVISSGRIILVDA